MSFDFACDDGLAIELICQSDVWWKCQMGDMRIIPLVSCVGLVMLGQHRLTKFRFGVSMNNF